MDYALALQSTLRLSAAAIGFVTTAGYEQESLLWLNDVFQTVLTPGTGGHILNIDDSLRVKAEAMQWSIVTQVSAEDDMNVDASDLAHGLFPTLTLRDRVFVVRNP